MKKAVITVMPNLSDTLFEDICSGFRKKLGGELCFERVNDDTVLGGFIAEIDGEVYDTSIKTKLKGMESYIKA